MFKTYAEVLEARRADQIDSTQYSKLRKEWEKAEEKDVNSLIAAGNTYLKELVEARETETTAREKRYELEKQEEKAAERFEFLYSLQSKEYNKKDWEKDEYLRDWNDKDTIIWRFYGSTVRLVAKIEIRKNLKVWKYEVSGYAEASKGFSHGEKLVKYDIEKFKTLEEAEKRCQEIREALYEAHKAEIEESENLAKQAAEVWQALNKYTYYNKFCYAKRF